MLVLTLKSLARTPEIGQGLERILSCGDRKQDLDGPTIIVDEPPSFFMTY